MLSHILTRTPVYVWAILAFLVYRGLVASRTREVALRKLAIIPLVMLALSLQGLLTGFGQNALVLGTWAVALLAGAALAWRRIDGAAITTIPSRGAVVKPGNWSTLALLMAIFMLKYAVAVAVAITPGLALDVLFSTSVAAVFGLFNGLFIGDALRYMAAYHHGAGALTARPAPPARAGRP